MRGVGATDGARCRMAEGRGEALRILTSFISRNFLVAFLITLVVFMFVMAVGTIFRVIDLFSRGVSGLFILRFFLAGMPFSLIFAIPMSVLAAAYLVFSRMSADREVIAMRASGINLWQIIQPPVLISTLLCALCVYINCSLAPKSHYARRLMVGSLGSETPLALLDEGRWINDIPNIKLYILRKSENKLANIWMTQFGEKGIRRQIYADRGTVDPDPGNPGAVTINLYSVRISDYDEHDPANPVKFVHPTAAHHPMRLDMSGLVGKGEVVKKRADLTMTELIGALRYGREIQVDASLENLAVHRMSLQVEVSTRLALSFSCYAFVLLGAALGVKIHRKESTVGLALILILVLAFFSFIALADSLVSRPGLRPDLIVWIPFLVAETIGFALIHRAH